MTDGISIIGTGRVGRCLALALYRAGFNIKSIFNTTVSVAEKLAETTNPSLVKSSPESSGELASIVFICVPDDAIHSVATKISELTVDWSGHSFIHCSGARSADDLVPLSRRGARTASFHPIQTFPLEPDTNVFHDIWISLQGDNKLLDLLAQYASGLGARSVRVSAEQKQQIHIAAVFACNYVVTLCGAAQKLLPDDSQGLELLAPLMRQTLDGILSVGPEKALTGPLMRGDIQTLQNHLEALDDYPELKKIYTSLGSYTVTLLKEISAKPGNIDQVSALFDNK